MYCLCHNPICADNGVIISSPSTNDVYLRALSCVSDMSRNPKPPTFCDAAKKSFVPFLQGQSPTGTRKNGMLGVSGMLAGRAEYFEIYVCISIYFRIYKSDFLVSYTINCVCLSISEDAKCLGSKLLATALKYMEQSQYI